jgi:hypothetical protein
MRGVTPGRSSTFGFFDYKTLEDHCGRRGPDWVAVVRGLVVKPITFRLHREWHRPRILWRGLRFSGYGIIRTREVHDRWSQHTR